jgi:DEAD/DEAH box helicase domain-containing protein
MDVAALIRGIESRADYAGQIAHVEVLPERPGRFAQPEQPLTDELVELLRVRGIEDLYTHQSAALAAARAGRDWVVVTGTASGKTLCYNLPILEACFNDDQARALYLFPTKALAQDQLKGLLELVGGTSMVPGVYDGDTPTAQRRRIRGEAQLVLSNPDMLHAAILPYHPKWAAFFSELRFVVIDEVHTYRGILGAHVSAVLRRLVRICEHYGSRPTFLCASATIANPGELAGRLLGRPVEVIDDDGSPRGRKYFVLWNPTPLGRDQLARNSAADDAVTWLAEAIQRDGQALASRGRGRPPSSSTATPAKSWPASVRRWPIRCGPIAAATCRTSGGRSSRICSAGNSVGLLRRMPWSWVSTSARSTWPCS